VSYPDSVRYLYALGNELKAGAKFGLERMEILLRELGNPERNQQFIHVAGTNGKGSTCAMIASVLRAAGVRGGLYTSPHLVEPTERIQVNGVAVTEEEFARSFEIVHAAAERLIETGRVDAHPSYFETVTAMAFMIFREHCETSVMEVGLGGRLDATNVITPRISVITPVSFDHESFLGNTLESIAGEKAGILKPGVPVVISRQSPEVESLIRRRARELGCDVISADLAPEEILVSSQGSRFSLDGTTYECLIAGRHQIENAVTAITVCETLGMESKAIQSGLRDAKWPGRLEVARRRPDFILDGAHNPAGARALAAYIREFRSTSPVWLVYGAMRDKAIEEVTAQLFPLADRLILTAPDFPRALRPEAILAVQSHPNVTVTHMLPDAIAIATTAPPEAVVFFTGSLYLVGEARRLLAESGPAFS
jgi:dihydrofolate synthase / folylpolyglutamate synthase